MKKEQAKKSKLWIVLVIIAALLLVAGGVAAFFLMGQGAEPEGPKGGRAEIYWNVDRAKYTEGSASGLSTREPGADGLYHITFAIDGSQVEFTCADKKVVNRIDMNMAMGLVFDADGVIVDMVAADSIATVVANSMYVQYLENGVLTVNSSIALNGMAVEVPISDITGIYNCDKNAETVGMVGETQAMDLVLAYQNDLGETTHVFIVERVPESKVYWRLERFFDSDTAQTTRVPDENGVYTIAFSVDTVHVELKCKDRDLVNAIDTKKDHNCAYGFTFDEEGYITGIIDPGLAVKGAAHATNMDVVEMTDTSFVALRRLPGNGQGSDYDGIITENTKIYNVNTSSEVMGEETQLQMGDRLFVLANTKNEAEIIFIINRLMDTPMYYTPSVKYDSTNRITTRVPDAQGRYVYEVYWGGGEHKQVWTKNITLATQLDSYKYRGFGLKLSEDDEILDVYYHTCVYGYSYTLVNMFLTNVTGQIIAGYSYTSEVAQTGIMREDCKVYDYSDFATVKGEVTTLRQHDRVVTYRDSDGLIAEVHVLLRTAPDTELYYNLGRKYSSTTKETTREPINGWYVFTLAKDGKQVTAKTSDKALASKIDSFSPAAVALKVVNGIIYECYRGEYAFIGGSYRTSNYIVREIDMERSEFGSYRSDYTTVTLNPNVYRNIWTTMGENVKVYNVSENVKSHRGEETTLQIGDKIHAIRDKSGDAVVIFVTLRDVKTGPAASWDYKYSETTLETTRKPDADGYYVYTIARDGKVGTYKTKDKELATKIDAFGDVFAFTNDGDIITNVLDIKYVSGIDSDTGSKYDVHAYGNGKITIKKNRPTSSDAFKEYTFDVSSKVQVIDFTPGENFGQKGEVTLGDRIILLRDDKKVVQIICILQKNVREAGARGICPDCGEDVFWEPWTGGGFTTREGYHYYMAADVEREAGLKFSNTDKDFKVVLDLNGHTLTTNNRIAAIQNNETFVILDTSKAQTGTIQGVGSAEAEGGANGGGLFIYGGNFKMYSGTVKLCEENYHNNKQGGAVYIGQNSTAELLGGKIIGTDANTSGGAVHIVNSSVKIGGDMQILGGVAPKGNSVFVTGESTVDVSGNAVIEGGMQVADGELTLSGKPQITAGDSDYSLKLTNGAVATLGALEDGAKIGITASGAFTQAFADDAAAQKYVKFFYSDDAKKTIVVQDKSLVAYQPPVAAPDAVCEHCGETVEWIAWNGEKVTEAGHYYLANDVMLDAAVGIGETEGENFHVVIDLNGCTISSAQSVFMVRYGEKLTILDSSEAKTGTAIGIGRGADKNAGVLQAYNDSKNGAPELEILGGTYILTEGSKTKAGGVIHANDGSVVTIKDATLKGGISTATGGVIYANGATVTIDGKTYITGGQSAEGDNIYTEGNAKLTIKGEAKIDGGVEIKGAASVTLAGKITVAKTEGGSEYGIKLTNASPKLNIEGLETGAKIGVTADGIFTQKDADADTIKDCFVSDDSSKPITVVGGAISAGQDESYSAYEAMCEHCGQTVTWENWDGSNFSSNGHYYVPEGGLELAAQCSINGEYAVVIDLKGETVSCTTNKVFYVTGGGDLTIVDSEGTGTVIGTGRGSDKHAGTLQAYNNGKLTILGGTYKRTEDSQINRGGVVYGNTGCEIVIKNATIVGGTAAEGGAIYANGAKLTIGEGAVIKAGSAPKGDTIYATATATVTVEDATIEGGIELTETVGAVKFSGKVIIEKTTSAYSVKLAEGVKIDATGLTAGSSIAITKAAVGVFTTEFADEAAAEAAKAYFKADDGTEITVSGKALSYGVIAPPPAGEMAYCEHCQQEVEWNAWDGTAVTGDAHLYIPEAGTVVPSRVAFKDGHVVIDLKGHALSSEKQMFRVGANADMYIIDSVGGGTVTAKGESAHGGIAMFNGAGHLTITGGTFALAADETFNEASYNGGLFAFTSAADGKLTITGGTFKAADAKNGDTIYVYGTVNVLEIGGNAVIEGGVQVDSAEAVILSGTPTIQKVAGGAYGLKVASGKVVDATGLTTGASIGITADGVFTTDFADAAAAEAAKGFFTCEVADNEISVEGNALKAAPIAIEPEPTEPEATTEATEATTEATEATTEATTAPTEPVTKACEHCGQTVAWTEWDGLTFAEGGHYYVPEGLAQLSTHAVVTGMEVVLDLNGQTVTSAGKVFHVTNSGDLTIVDSSEAKSGTVIGTGKGSGTNAGVIQVYKNASSAKLTILGGTYKLAENTQAKNGAIIHANTTTEVVIKNATIYGAKGALGAAIDFDGAKAVIGEGAVIKAGVATTYGDSVYVTGSGADVTIEANAVIEGGLYVTGSAAGKVTVQGTPVIQKVEGGSAYSFMGSTLNVGALEAGASIGITKAEDGVFTTDFADAAAAEAAKAFFTADDATKEISVEGLALKVAAIATEPEPTTEATEAPTEETTAPTEATTAPTEETTAPTEATTAPTEETTAPTEAAGETCEHCGQAVEWKAWDGLTFTEGGHYYVPENLPQLTTHATVKAMEVVLDLNGQTVESTVKALHVADGGELTILDSSEAKSGTVIGKGKGTGTNAGVIQVYQSKDTEPAAKLTILGGTYKMKEGSQAKNGGIIHANKNCEVVVKNATIEGGTAVLGAAIYVYDSVKLTVGEGAVIKAGTASTYGDTIYVTANTPQIVIEGNAQIEGGVYATGTAAGVITVQGTPVIQKVEGGSEYSFKGSTLKVGELAEGALIGITKVEDGAFTTEFATPVEAAAALKYFVSDDAAKAVKAKGTVLVTEAITDIAAATCNCETCQGAAPTWTAWDGQNITAGGHYYLAEDMAVSGTIAVGNAEGEDFNAIFNLNGKTLSTTVAKKIFQVKNGDTLTIVDSSAQGTGAMVGTPGTSHAGVVQAYGGHVVFEGGNFYLSSDKAANYNGGIVYASSKGTITVHGGEFWGGNYKNGGVFAQAAGTMEITGGVIHAGTATAKGDAVYVYSGDTDAMTLVIGGDAVIEGGVEVAKGVSDATVSISGKPVIEKIEGGSAYSLKLAEGAVVTVGALEEGAKIAVTAADGAFTAAFADEAAATAAAAFFATDDATKAIKVENLALVIGAAEAAA